jgi:hypothetical protein
MIDTDKYEGMTYNNSIKMGIELEIAVENLLAEVKRLREVAYRKDMQVGERDREVKRLRKMVEDYKAIMEMKK